MYVDVTTTQVIVGGVITLLGGGTFGSAALWLLNRRKYNVDVVPAEGTGMELLLSRIKGLLTEKLKDAKDMHEMHTELGVLRVLVEVRDAELLRHGSMLREILIEQGRASEREKLCQSRLDDALVRIEEFKGLHDVNRRLVQDNLRMQGEIDEISKPEG